MLDSDAIAFEIIDQKQIKKIMLIMNIYNYVFI